MRIMTTRRISSFGNIFPSQGPTVSAYVHLASRSRLIYWIQTTDLILCGNLNVQALERFMNEFFNTDTGNHSNSRNKVVLLCPEEPNPDMDTFLKTPKYTDKMFYIKGSPHLESDLHKARAHLATKIFIISNSTRTVAEEERFILIASIAIEKFLMRNSPNPLEKTLLVAQAHTRDAEESLRAAHVDVPICLSSFKAQLMAFGTQFPGFIPLFTNLIRSAETNEDVEDSDEHRWLFDYLDGTKYEVYYVEFAHESGRSLAESRRNTLGEELETTSFAQVAAELFKDDESQVILVAVCEIVDDASTTLAGKVAKKITICPGNDYAFSRESAGIFVIAEDYKDAVRAVSALEREKIEKNPKCLVESRRQYSGVDNFAEGDTGVVEDHPLQRHVAALQDAISNNQYEVHNSVVELLRSYVAMENEEARQFLVDEIIGDHKLVNIDGTEKQSLTPEDDCHTMNDHILLCFHDTSEVTLDTVCQYITRYATLRFKHRPLVSHHSSNEKQFQKDLDFVLVQPNRRVLEGKSKDMDFPTFFKATLAKYMEATDAKVWKCFQDGRFRLRFIFGALDDPTTLKRTAVRKCHAVISFASAELARQIGDVDGTFNSGSGYSLDERSVLSSLHLEAELGDTSFEDVFVLNEFINNQSIAFLRQYTNEGRRYREIRKVHNGDFRTHLFQWPLFAAGHVCTQSILDTLIIRLSATQAEKHFWNSLFEESSDVFRCLPMPKEWKDAGELCILSQIDPINPHHRPSMTNRRRSSLLGKLDRQSTGSKMLEMERQVNAKTYGDLFFYCLQVGWVLLGLRRATGTRNAVNAYTHANANRNLPLYDTDMMFILVPNAVGKRLRTSVSTGMFSFSSTDYNDIDDEVDIPGEKLRTGALNATGESKNESNAGTLFCGL